MAEAADAGQLTGATITGTSGERLGTISEVAADPDTERPAWARVHVGFSGGRSAVVPLTEARRTRHGDPWVPYTKAQLLSAPSAESLTDLGPDTEWALLVHYGLAGGDPDRTPVQLPPHLADPGPYQVPPEAPPAGGPGPGGDAGSTRAGPEPEPRPGGRHRAAGGSRSGVLAVGAALVLLVLTVGLGRRSRPLPPHRQGGRRGGDVSRGGRRQP